MNRINNFLLGIVLTGVMAFGFPHVVDTDRRVVPALESAKILVYDMVAQQRANAQRTFNAVALVYNNGGHGTAFFIGERTLLTNHHMVAKANFWGGMDVETNETVTIQLRNGRQLEARVVKSSPDVDIAMLEIDEDVSHGTLHLAEHTPVEGTWVYIAGNGGFDFWWAKGGYLKGSYKFTTPWNNTQSVAHMKSKGGFSGSPVINFRTGEVVGVHAGGSPQMALGIHVGLDDIKKFLNQSPQEANPYLKKETTMLELGTLDQMEFPEVPGVRHNFMTWPSHLDGVDPGNWDAIEKYMLKFNIRYQQDGDQIRFSGPRQASTHLLHHIYFGNDLGFEGSITKLYIHTDSVNEDQYNEIEKFLRGKDVTVEYFQRSQRVIFTGPKPVLLSIANYLFRQVPLS